MKTKALCALLISVAVGLCGCTSSVLHLEQDTAPVELPQTEISFAAPIGDASLTLEETVKVDVPSTNGIGLTQVELKVNRSFTRPRSEAIVRAMLNFEGSGAAEPLGGAYRLTLSGTDPVEVSGNTVTVNLGPSALSLDRERLYICGQALANTLWREEGIAYLNLLVSGKPLGLDMGNTLPMGAFQYSQAADVRAVYQSLLTRKVAEGETETEKPLAVNMTRYLPVPGENALFSETESIHFSGQFSGTLAVEILRMMAKDGDMPDLAELLKSVPSVIASDEAGGDLLLLDFSAEAEQVLESSEVNRTAVMAAICKTFSTFLPNVVGISVTVGGDPVDPMFLMEESSAEAHREIILRRDTGCALYDSCVIYLGSSTGLVRVIRPVSYEKTHNPRELLLEVAQGPKPNDSAVADPISGMSTLNESMIIGMALQGDTMLINFAPGFVNAGTGLSGEEEKQMVYAMVNTLCETGLCRNVCFFRSGRQFEGFSGAVSWLGLFYPVYADQ